MRFYLGIALAVFLTTHIPAVAESDFDGTTTQAHNSSHSVGISGSTSCLPAEIRTMLAAIARRYGAVTVISAHRSHAVIAGTRRPSYHRNCRAVDFRVDGKWAAWRWINSNWSGGAGIYSSRRSNHIHIDNGPRRRWHN